MNRALHFIIFVLVLISLHSSLVLGATSYRGSLHQHTGFSTWWGYDGVPDSPTPVDDCVPDGLEGHFS